MNTACASQVRPFAVTLTADSSVRGIPHIDADAVVLKTHWAQTTTSGYREFVGGHQTSSRSNAANTRCPVPHISPMEPSAL